MKKLRSISFLGLMALSLSVNAQNKNLAEGTKGLVDTNKLAYKNTLNLHLGFSGVTKELEFKA